MALSILTGVLFLMGLAPARAAEPTPTTPDEYLRQLYPDGLPVESLRLCAFGWPALDRGDPELSCAALQKAMREWYMDASPWKGDATLRDAGLAHLDVVVKIQEGQERWTTELLARQLVTADLAQIEERRQSAEASLSSSEAAWRAARQAFASRHQVEMKEVESPPEAVFGFPSIVPAGSHLSATEHVRLALTYHDGLSATLEASRTSLIEVAHKLDDTGPELEQARVAALEVVRSGRAEVDRAGPWQADDELRSAALHCQDRWMEMLDGHVREAAALQALPRRKNKDYIRLVQLREALLEDTAEVEKGWTSARNSFLVRWGVRAQAAWYEERGER